jgi:hypothetical protein
MSGRQCTMCGEKIKQTRNRPIGAQRHMYPGKARSARLYARQGPSMICAIDLWPRAEVCKMASGTFALPQAGNERHQHQHAVCTGILYTLIHAGRDRSLHQLHKQVASANFKMSASSSDCSKFEHTKAVALSLQSCWSARGIFKQ